MGFFDKIPTSNHKKTKLFRIPFQEGITKIAKMMLNHFDQILLHPLSDVRITCGNRTVYSYIALKVYKSFLI